MMRCQTKVPLAQVIYALARLHARVAGLTLKSRREQVRTVEPPSPERDFSTFGVRPKRRKLRLDRLALMVELPCDEPVRTLGAELSLSGRWTTGGGLRWTGALLPGRREPSQKLIGLAGLVEVDDRSIFISPIAIQSAFSDKRNGSRVLSEHVTGHPSHAQCAPPPAPSKSIPAPVPRRRLSHPHPPSNAPRKHARRSCLRQVCVRNA